MVAYLWSSWRRFEPAAIKCKCSRQGCSPNSHCNAMHQPNIDHIQQYSQGREAGLAAPKQGTKMTCAGQYKQQHTCKRTHNELHNQSTIVTLAHGSAYQQQGVRNSRLASIWNAHKSGVYSLPPGIATTKHLINVSHTYIHRPGSYFWSITNSRLYGCSQLNLPVRTRNCNRRAC